MLSHFQKFCPMMRRRQSAKFQSGNFTQVTVCEGRSPTASLKSRSSPHNDAHSPHNGALLSNGKKDDSYELTDLSEAVKHTSVNGSAKTSPINGVNAEKTSNSTPTSKGYSPVPTIVTTDA